jgi:hypothetical protein
MMHEIFNVFARFQWTKHEAQMGKQNILQKFGGEK